MTTTPETVPANVEASVEMGKGNASLQTIITEHGDTDLRAMCADPVSADKETYKETSKRISDLCTLSFAQTGNPVDKSAKSRILQGARASAILARPMELPHGVNTPCVKGTPAALKAHFAAGLKAAIAATGLSKNELKAAKLPHAGDTKKRFIARCVELVDAETHDPLAAGKLFHPDYIVDFCNEVISDKLEAYKKAIADAQQAEKERLERERLQAQQADGEDEEGAPQTPPADDKAETPPADDKAETPPADVKATDGKAETPPADDKAETPPASDNGGNPPADDIQTGDASDQKEEWPSAPNELRTMFASLALKCLNAGIDAKTLHNTIDVQFKAHADDKSATSPATSAAKNKGRNRKRTRGNGKNGVTISTPQTEQDVDNMLSGV